MGDVPPQVTLDVHNATTEPLEVRLYRVPNAAVTVDGRDSSAEGDTRGDRPWVLQPDGTGQALVTMLGTDESVEAYIADRKVFCETYAMQSVQPRQHYAVEVTAGHLAC